jgi:hypothetical protein
LDEIRCNAAILHAWSNEKRAETLAHEVGAQLRWSCDVVILQPNNALSHATKEVDNG